MWQNIESAYLDRNVGPHIFLAHDQISPVELLIITGNGLLSLSRESSFKTMMILLCAFGW